MWLSGNVHLVLQDTSLTSTAALTSIQGWFGGESDAVAATAGVRSDLAAVEAAAEERRKLHDAFKRQWNEDDIIQVSTEQSWSC